MYKNRKPNKNAQTKSATSHGDKRCLNTIDENASIKIPRLRGAVNIADAKNAGDLEDVLSSEENIPASQEPTQRYLSQRSTIAATLGRTQSRLNSSQRPPNTYFELVLMKAGVQLDEGENFVLACNHVAFVGKLRELLDRNHSFKDNYEMFKNGLSDAWSRFAIKLLTGCTISIPGEESIYQSQNSMIVNFFMIDRLRDHVLQLLLEKIERAACESNPTASAHKAQSAIPLLPLMLTQLQYVANTHSDIIYQRITKVFENALEQSKWDIIANAEFVFGAQKHDDFAQLLLDNIASSKELFKNLTVQTLTNLNLSQYMQGKIRAKILAFIKDDQCPKTTLPLLIKFLLKVLTEDSEDNMKELVNTLREILNWNDNEEATILANDKQLQLELFGCIEQGFIRSKKFYTIWQKTIASLTASQFKPIDFIIVLLLIHIKDDNSFLVENMLRRHIRQISTSIVKVIRKKYAPILEHHWNILMQIINGFLRDKHKSIVDFARVSCGTFFDISESVQKLVLKKLLELTCEKTNQNTTNFALQMLRDLWHMYPKILHNWGMLLLPFLDHIHEMSLSQTRIVMELLSSIAYPAPTLDECTTLQDQIDMLIKKQIINRNSFVKKQGIISAVQLIDCIARVEQSCIEPSDFNTTFNTVSDLPEGRGKIAANYMVRIQTSTISSPECLALFYDELAIVCSAGGDDRANGLLLDIPFLIWMCELMTYYFQNSFVAEHQAETVQGIPLAYSKCINMPTDVNTEESDLPQIAINIAELVLRPCNEAISSILVLAPLFNLVRVLHMQRYEGSLEIINALLGCAIILPKSFDDPNFYAIFCDYDESMKKKLLDIYFHCINWVRETVSSFATQREPMIRKKVLQRLVELIDLEDKLRQLLVKAPRDYTPPQCHFITESSTIAAANKGSGGRGRPAGAGAGSKKASNKTKPAPLETQTMNLNDTTLNEATTRDVTIKLAGTNKSKSSVKSNFENLYGPKEVYRQMHTNIILVLNEKLNIKYPLPEKSIGFEMGLLEFRFVLTDIVSKLESVVGIQKFQSEQPLQYIAKPGFFMCDLSEFIYIIADNIKQISIAINSKLEAVQRVYSHADLFTDEFNLLKICFGLCLRLLVAFYSWSEWSVNEQRLSKLKDSLLVLLNRKKSPTLNNKSIGALAVDVFQVIMAYETSVVDLKSSVYLYKLVSTLNELSDKDFKQNQAHDIRSLCRTLLCRKWFNYEGHLEKGAQCNFYLDELVKGFLRDSDFKRQHGILRVVREESKLLNGKDSSLKSFPNFKKANFPLFFRGLCEILITSLNEKITRNSLKSMDKLEFWESSCKLLNTLLEILQGLDIPKNFQIFLKYSHLYLKLVLQHGLPVFEQYLRQNPERVCELIKTMQTTTRYLHHLCCHSKALKNTVIVSQIPFLRETVENYVFHIKALLTANKCASVFLMGNLKNKDLHGDDLIQQAASSITTDTPVDSDEDIPEDDISVDESVVGCYNENARNDTENRSKSSSRSKCF